MRERREVVGKGQKECRTESRMSHAGLTADQPVPRRHVDREPRINYLKQGAITNRYVPSSRRVSAAATTEAGK